MSNDLPQAPDATFVKRRWIPRYEVEYARECDRIIREHGAVTGSITYAKPHQARWRAQYLIRLLVQLDMYPRWELREHTDRWDGGYRWTVEHVPRYVLFDNPTSGGGKAARSHIAEEDRKRGLEPTELQLGHDLEQPGEK